MKVKNSKEIKKQLGLAGKNYLNKKWGDYTTHKMFYPRTKLTFEEYLTPYTN